MFSIHFSILCVLFLFALSLAKFQRKQRSALKNFPKLTGKYLCRNRSETLLRKSPPAQVFFCDFCNLFRTPFLRSFPEAFSIVITWNPNRFWIFHFSNFSFFSFLSIRPVYQQRRQLAVRFYSKWCIMRSRVGVLARQSRLAMTWWWNYRLPSIA